MEHSVAYLLILVKLLNSKYTKEVNLYCYHKVLKSINGLNPVLMGEKMEEKKDSSFQEPYQEREGSAMCLGSVASPLLAQKNSLTQ